MPADKTILREAARYSLAKLISPMLELKPPLNSTHASSSPSPATRLEELGKIILAYSEVTERLQQSQDQLQRQVAHLRAELSEKNKLLERKNRLAALGEMAAGMAHEIRNPLGGIQLYASLLGKDVADRPASLELVGKISGGVKRLEALVSQVLQFAREIRANVGPADLGEIVEQTLDLTVQQRTAAGVSCQTSGPRPMPVMIDAVLVGQSLLNLVLNAVESMSQSPRCGPGEKAAESRRLTVRFGPPPQGSDARQFHLTVCDSGPGIPPGVLDRIFNPFFTTKDTGTGLGLAIVHRVVEAHEGSITASNIEGGGAKFEIRI
jgi:two-component system sensor histidine kinase HydH